MDAENGWRGRMETRLDHLESEVHEAARHRRQLWLVMVPTIITSVVALVTRLFA
jgi:hypothetical protein